MVVIRLSKSGKALLVYDDLGNAYMTSVAYTIMLLEGRARNNMLLLQQLGEGVSTERFKPKGDLTINNDALSYGKNKETKESAVIEDKNIW